MLQRCKVNYIMKIKKRQWQRDPKAEILSNTNKTFTEAQLPLTSMNFATVLKRSALMVCVEVAMST